MAEAVPATIHIPSGNETCYANSMDAAEKLTAAGSDDGRYRLLLDAVTDYAIYMLDRDGIVTSWNAGARRFKGYEAHEVIGSHF